MDVMDVSKQHMVSRASTSVVKSCLAAAIFYGDLMQEFHRLCHGTSSWPLSELVSQILAFLPDRNETQ